MSTITDTNRLATSLPTQEPLDPQLNMEQKPSKEEVLADIKKRIIPIRQKRDEAIIELIDNLYFEFAFSDYESMLNGMVCTAAMVPKKKDEAKMFADDFWIYTVLLDHLRKIAEAGKELEAIKEEERNTCYPQWSK